MSEGSTRVCSLCDTQISAADLDDPDSIYRQVTSWVTGAKLHSPVLREQTGRVAHRECIQKVVDGEAPDQQEIPGME